MSKPEAPAIIFSIPIVKVPLVSVGMPVLDCEKTLAGAIRSVLWQTHADWELLIMDDGSSDRTLEVARGFGDSRIRVIADGKRRGLSSRLNQAIALSRGQYFARMDGDDIAYPQRFERQVCFLREHPEVDLLGTGILVFRGNGEAIGTRTIFQDHKGICDRPWAGIYLPHPTWMGRLSWFRDHPYRAGAVRMEDQDLLFRTYKRSTFASLSDILLGYREDSFSLRKALRGRLNLAKLYARRALPSGADSTVALLGVVNHGFKALVELFAVATGMNYRILRHRAIPADRGALEDWKGHWTRLTAPELDEEQESLLHSELASSD